MLSFSQPYDDIFWPALGFESEASMSEFSVPIPILNSIMHQGMYWTERGSYLHDLAISEAVLLYVLTR